MRTGRRPRLPGPPCAGILPARRMNGRPFFSLLHSWTGRRPIPPPDSGRPLARLAVAPIPGGQTASVSAYTVLLTIGFAAATTIDPPGTRIKLITGQGSCEILNALADQGVPCLDLNATMTASR